MVSAKLIADSTNWLGNRVSTFVLIYPRYIHAEFMTHRVFSKNSASSRAIPVSKMIEEVRTNTVYPMWTRNKKGMQGEIIEDEELIKVLDRDWEFSRDFNINEAGALNDKGVHKQHANRTLEPFQNIKIICTGTDWENFFELRDHKDAMPEIQILAKSIKNELLNNQPTYLEQGDWHIPFGDRVPEVDLLNRSYKELLNSTNWEYEPDKHLIADHIKTIRIKIATARCARISYNNFEGTIDVEKDIDLFNKLVESRPRHFSPTEHICKVPTDKELKHFNAGYIYTGSSWKYTKGKYISNLNGWIQLRKLIENGEFN